MPKSNKPQQTENSESRTSTVKSLSPKRLARVLTSVTHDGFFKNMISNIPRARIILKWILPAEKAAVIDWSRLKKEPESFLDKDMKNCRADAVFHAPVKMTNPDGVKEEIPCYLFFVLEHKSTDCYKTVFQILRYIIRIWERDHEDHGSRDRRLLPFVVPIIFHNGLEPFKSPVNLREMVAPVPGFEDLIPNWPVILIDLQKMDPNEFPKKKNADLFLDAMKSILTADGNEQIDRIIKRFRENRASSSGMSTDDLYSLLLYISRRSIILNRNAMEEQMSQAADLLDSTQVMSAYDLMCVQNRAEGRIEGRIEGRAEGVTEGEARGLLHLAEFAFGQVSEELESLVLGIQDQNLIDKCYEAVKSGKIKDCSELKAKIQNA